MIAVESSIERHDAAAVTAPEPKAGATLFTVKVYTRHNRTCPKRDRSDWARSICVKRL